MESTSYRLSSNNIQMGSAIIPIVIAVAVLIGGLVFLGEDNIDLLVNQFDEVVVQKGTETINNSKNNQGMNTTDSPVTDALVEITNDGFVPSSITVAKGQVVVWTNNDGQQHQLTPYPNSAANNSQVPGFDPDPLSTGDSFSYVYEKSGQYTYQSTQDPNRYQGIVIVK